MFLKLYDLSILNDDRYCSIFHSLDQLFDLLQSLLFHLLIFPESVFLASATFRQDPFKKNIGYLL